jgi:recombination protein RecA
VGGKALYIDSENKLNLQYASNLGVNVKELVVSQPEYGEAAFQIAEIFIKNEAVGIIVVDSVAMLVPKSEYEGEIGDGGVGQLSRMVTQAIRKLKDKVRKSNVAMVMINQVRDKIGISFGNPETTPAGHALKHQASVRMDIRRIAALKNGDKVIGARTKAKVVKNTFANPFQECEYDLIYGEGVSKEAELVDLAAPRGVLEKTGAMYSYNGERLGHGREATRLLLKQHPDIFQEVYEKVRKMMIAELVKVPV